MPLLAPNATDSLDGLTLETILTQLVEGYGWEDLGREINIKCFTDNPSINSSLKFLRKTPWARAKVESLYLYARRRKIVKGKQPPTA